jgi:ribonuclease HIII
MKCWIGTDESGKGDYFGALVVAAVAVDEATAVKLKDLGVKDSKTLSDSRATSLSESIQEMCPFSVVVVGPPKYNELYSKFRNLNRLLAWGHARVIENLLHEAACDTVITDKFGDERFVERALMTKGKQVKLIQRHGAEDDIAVAAASVVARHKFLQNLDELSTQVGMQLPKGAGQPVDDAARLLIEKHGEDLLQKVAKVHFKTTRKVMETVDGAKTKSESHKTRDATETRRHGEWGSGREGDETEKMKTESQKPKSERRDATSSTTHPSPVDQDSGRLWAPWRAEYILSEKSESCIFCNLEEDKDRETLVLHRESGAFVIMNKFPYNNGHLMVVPCRHVGDIGELTQEESLSLWELVQRSVRVLEMKMKPQGFNVGMNLGRIAGAGVEGHLHIHVVPRWSGDVNFMPAISDTKVISQSLEEAYDLLKQGFVETERTNTRKEIEY